jgi:hypothetical protein
MPTGKTVQGNRFCYSGSLEAGIVVSFTFTALRISPEVIRAIRAEIIERSAVLMGSSRKPLVPNSLGEMIWLRYHVTPQAVSYIVPLLIEEGFCRASESKPFIIFYSG